MADEMSSLVLVSKDATVAKPNTKQVLAKVYTIEENPSSRLLKNFLNKEVQIAAYLKDDSITVGKDKEGKPITAQIRNPVLDAMKKLSSTIKDAKVQGRWDGKRYSVCVSKWNTHKKENKIKV